mmetsp:Transcript_21896/g.36262  ORF Transcript_21896/g.36262 Transcript_21896/m.36262 type:complete len:355 (-) Transcript_21896:379-1443(-)|eukprot:CAMPEP_0184643686 /NCGR_PEP_ID=MMETSP0308-20130426/511_1 /TAXON_ID=38269 /ORGANISM="Gloeochaete witrockiana, Strain SAG 46.84" /LENGTH=354 /DNA_ID=CAMNT_0027071771 /DNA_START=94 /DNA_END=1158 /DNA_ORIENTATION=+
MTVFRKIYASVYPTLLSIVERNVVPDAIIRRVSRQLLASQLQSFEASDIEKRQEEFMQFVEELRASPIAIHTDAANQQHYEVPAEFFLHVLGKHLKYSSCYFPPGVTSLDDAEECMLRLYVERAQISDGMEVLELGCGWGSFSMYVCERFPKLRLTTVSNSASQKEFIQAQCKARHIENLTVITADVNSFSTESKFDRIVSIEMFEHMKNYEQLLKRISSWLKPEGLLFIHIFTHARFAYHFDASDSTDFMSNYFFTGGTMNSDDTLLYFQDNVKIVNHWRVNGEHYGKTSECWLQNLDKKAKEVRPILEKVYGKDQATKWFVYWRLFFIACAECFAYGEGKEWIVSHYLFKKA